MSLSRPWHRMASWAGLLISLGLGSAKVASAASGFVQASGTTLVVNGSVFTPRGVNLGNWFVLEPYMIGGGSSNEQVRQAFVTLAGSSANYQTWRAAYLSNYVTQADVQRLKAAGFNTVRVPLDWRDCLNSKGNALLTGTYPATLPSGAPVALAYLDNLLNWCTSAGMYVLLDMHVTPSTVDGDNEIYVSSTSQVSTTLNAVKTAWSTLAQRYRNATNLLGYDLLNEPPGYINDDYRPTYQQIQSAIRQYDTNHLLVVESNVYADLGDTINGDGYLGTPIDANMAVSIHSYGDTDLPPLSIDADYPTDANDYNGRAYYAWEYANKENVPVLIGETGENNNNWINGIVHLWSVGKVGAASAPITAGVLYWTYKKPGDSVRAVVSVPFTPGWSAIENYLNNGGTVPANALSLLNSQATLGAYANETFHPDVADALLRDYHATLPAAYPTVIPTIPGTVNAAWYDLGLAATTATPGDDTPYASFSANAQTSTYQVRDDVVGTYLLNGGTSVGGLNAGDWQHYQVNVTPGLYQVFLTYGAAGSGAQAGLSLNGAALLTSAALAATGSNTTPQEASIGTVTITASGQGTLRLTTVTAGLDCAAVRFAAVPPAAPTGLSGSATDTSATVNWTASPGATGYTVSYSAGGTTQSVSAAQPPGVLSGLSPGTTYAVSVAAFDGGGSSAPSGSINVTTLSAVQAWKLAHYGSSTISDNATPDGDGLPILLKYATGLTPGVPATNPMTLATSGGRLQVQFQRLTPATVTYTLEGSNDLSSWTVIDRLVPGSDQWNGTGTVSETAASGGTVSVVVTDAQTMAASTGRFLRLRLTDPGP